MVQRKQIINYINQLLAIDQFKDYSPNGLQVEGREQVTKIVSGVTACQALIDRAQEDQADLLLVHHGYFWKGEPAIITGMKKRRIKALLQANINLAAYHLPLDAHQTLGNNVLLGRDLGISLDRVLPAGGNPNLLHIGYLAQPQEVYEFAQHIETQLQRSPLVEKVNHQPIQKIAWCTGAAEDFMDIAIEQQCDAFLTGEVSERSIHAARENQIHFFAAGHHATERYGIQALGQHVADHFQLNHEFIDINNPV
jgi:dinuclear metal center YbgI/SA1388 family protein